MTWTFDHSVKTKSDLVNYLRRAERFADGLTLLKTAVVGENHWYVVQDATKGLTYIGLDVMARGGIGKGWGSISTTEFDNPSQVDCPLSFLSHADEASAEAVGWRVRVRQYHAKRQERPALNEGSLVIYAGCKYRLVRPWGLRSGWQVARVLDDHTFRLKPAQLSKAVHCASASH